MSRSIEALRCLPSTGRADLGYNEHPARGRSDMRAMPAGIVRGRKLMVEGVMARKSRLFNRSDFDVRDSSITGIGQGLFPLRTVYRGDTIGPYTGKILTDEEVEREPYLSSLYNVWVCRDHWVWGEGPKASYTRYINHSDDPNARLVISTRWKKIRIEAVRRIRAGQEIFIDYGPEYWENVGIVKR